MARTTQFLTRIGVRPDWLRMRQVYLVCAVGVGFFFTVCVPSQHLANEMAHYASGKDSSFVAMNA